MNKCITDESEFLNRVCNSGYSLGWTTREWGPDRRGDTKSLSDPNGDSGDERVK